MAGGLSRGDVFLCSFPAPDKDRPVLILTRDAAISHLNTVTVSPVTSTIRGVPSEVRLDVDDGMKGPCAANCHNIVSVSQRRLIKRVGRVSSRRMDEVCSAIRFALGCG